MKAIMVMFDSLNRHMLPPYGCESTYAPNFRRLAERTVQFQNAYVCSMPCMPARRELHTGRPNFLHRSWGPLEPFDDSMPQILRNNGVHTHLATDHYHYFEPGGGTYHTAYTTWEFFRGQEGDPWIGQVAPPAIPETIGSNRPGRLWQQDWINRGFMQHEDQQPQPQTFRAGLDYIRRNHEQDRWFLQIETFDPHEPFFTQRKYKDIYWEHYHKYRGRHFDWPPYGKLDQSAEEAEHVKYEYLALVAMCDAYLGEVLDVMDELDLWKDTMLIVCTDHGFMLGEHECWAKCWQPFYQEIAHVPLWIWDPRSGAKNERRNSLVQMIDFAPTLLEYFGLEPTADMIGRPLRETIAADAPVRDAALFGIFGGQINVTDGRFVYMRGPQRMENTPLYEYTLMPTHMQNRFAAAEIAGRTGLAEAFGFTKDCPLLKIAIPPRQHPPKHPEASQTFLWDLHDDPHQQRPVQDQQAERQMIDYLMALMRQCDAPPEQFERMGLK